MLIGYACPVERPKNEGAGHEYDDRVRQDDAPIRENPFVEVARHEAREPGGVIVGRHYWVLVLLSFLSGYLLFRASGSEWRNLQHGAGDVLGHFCSLSRTQGLR